MGVNQDGWVSWAEVAGVDGVHVRVRRTDAGRLVVTDLYVHGGALTAETLRRISIARIEATLNAPVEDVEDPAGAVMLFATQQWAADPVPDDDLTLGQLRTRARSRDRGQAKQAPGRQPLGRPDGTDDFYRRLAVAYAEYAADSHTPAKLIAEETGAPVGSVHRWIAEARRRGHLPPGQKGRAG